MGHSLMRSGTPILTANTKAESGNRSFSSHSPLSGSGRIFWRDGCEDAAGGLFDVFKAFDEQFRVSAVEANVVL